MEKILIFNDYYDYQIAASSILIYFEYQVRKIKLAEAIFRSTSCVQMNLSLFRNRRLILVHSRRKSFTETRQIIKLRQPEKTRSTWNLLCYWWLYKVHAFSVAGIFQFVHIIDQSFCGILICMTVGFFGNQFWWRNSTNCKYRYLVKFKANVIMCRCWLRQLYILNIYFLHAKKKNFWFNMVLISVR